MKIDLKKPICDLTGTPVQNGPSDLTISDVICNALLSPDSQDTTADEKVARFKLALKASNGSDPDFSAEDIVLLKKLIGKLFPPLVVGRAYEILEP